MQSSGTPALRSSMKQGGRSKRRVVTMVDLRTLAEVEDENDENAVEIIPSNESDKQNSAQGTYDLLGLFDDSSNHHVHFARQPDVAKATAPPFSRAPSQPNIPTIAAHNKPSNEPSNPSAAPAKDDSTSSKGGKARARGDRRVRTMNDLRSLMDQEGDKDQTAPDQNRMAELISAERPLTIRTRDPARETRLEMFQSHDHDKRFGKEEKELLEKKRSARQAKLTKRAEPRDLSKAAAAAAGGGGGGARDGGDGGGWGGKDGGYSSDGGASSHGDDSPTGSFRRTSLDLRVRGVKNLKKIQKNAHKTLKKIDPALKARVRRTEEIDKMLWVKISLTCAIGVCTGVCVQFISLLSTQVLMNPKQSAVQAMLRQGDLLGAFTLHAGISVVLAVMTAVIVVGLPDRLSVLYPGCPGAGGSGLPEVKTYLSGALDKHRMEEMRTLIAKIFALSLLIASGIPASRDMIHVAALIATNVVGLWGPMEKGLIESKIMSESFTGASDAPKFVLVSAAVAAGVGASFRCPFAGIIFAFEEFSSYWSQETASMCVLASGIASCVAWYFTGTDSASQWYLSNFEDTSGQFDPSIIRIVPAAFANVRYPTLKVLELSMLILLGVLGGLWGSIFVLVNGHGLAHWRKRNMGGKFAKYKRFAEITLVAIFTSAVAVLLPTLWPCRPLAEDEEAALLEKGQRISWKSSTCPPGFINEMSSLSFHGQGTAMNNLFAESNDMQFSASVLFAYGLVYFVVTVVSVGTASPAGAVIPMVLSGAAWGRALGVLFHDTFNWVGNQHPHVRFYAVMGGAAGLAGFFRMPLAVTAMIVEISGNSVFTAPLFISCTVAKIVADRVAKGFINFMCQFNDYPLLKEAPPAAFYHRNALDIMTELDAGVAYAPYMIGAADTLAHARWLLENTKHNSFPVVVDRERDWTLRGLVTRRRLADLIARLDKAGCGDGGEGDQAFRDGLAAVMEMNPAVVNEGMPADRVYSWFVSLGFRRLVVVKDGTMEVTGIITRHDLHEAFIKWRA